MTDTENTYHSGNTARIIAEPLAHANDNNSSSDGTPPDFSPAIGCRPVCFTVVDAVSTTATNDNAPFPDTVAA